MQNVSNLPDRCLRALNPALAFRRIRHLLRHGAAARFPSARQGQVAVIFSIMLVPLMMATGLGIEYTSIASSRRVLQIGLDAGVLAAATQTEDTDSESLERTITRYINANKGGRTLDSLKVKVLNFADLTVTAQAEACTPLTFAPLWLRQTSCFSVDARAEGGKTNLEVALVLDNTGSMDTASDRIGNLRSAATQLVDVLERGMKPGRKLKIALVPFVTSVNVRGAEFDMAWIDQTAANPLHGSNFELVNGRRANHFDLFSQLQLTWKGCVEARPAPHNLTDTAPNVGDPSTLFVPYFAPDEPGTARAGGNDGNAFNNSYLNDGATGTHAQIQGSLAKYMTALPRPVPIVEIAGFRKGGLNVTNGPNRACPTPIQPLTSNFVDLRAQIDQMRHWNGSGTNVSEGLMWGWRVLSPGAPYTGGRPFDDPRTQKVVVLLTDGENVVFGANTTPNGSDYSSYGFLSNGRMGSTDRVTATRNVDAWTLATCNALKRQGVILYTITLEAGTPANKTLYGACATTPSQYLDSPSATQLNGIFADIARQLVSLRLSK